jgi:hypothetical protein
VSGREGKGWGWILLFPPESEVRWVKPSYHGSEDWQIDLLIVGSGNHDNAKCRCSHGDQS